MAEYKKKIKEAKESMARKNFPEELILDILSRLPVKSLLRFRCVCKPWCALITDPTFVKMHLNRSLATNTNPSIIFLDGRHRRSLFSIDLDAYEQEEAAAAAAVELDHPLKDRLESKIYVVGSCNGLLCLKNTVGDILLWNPSTRRHQKLPVTPTKRRIVNYNRCIAYGFGYEPTTDDYKVLRIVQVEGDVDSWYSEANVYSLSTNSWRKIGGISCYHISCINGFGLLANFSIHWLAETDYMTSGSASHFLISFDLKIEEFGKVLLPALVDNNLFRFHWKVRVLGGQLCLVCIYPKVCVEVWTMKECGVKDSWAKQFSIEHPLVINPFNYFVPIGYSKNGEVILVNGSEVLILYDPCEGRVRTLHIRGIRGPDRLTTNICVGSLVPLNAKDGTE